MLKSLYVDHAEQPEGNVQEEAEKYDNNPDWIREIIEKSKVSNLNNTWNCWLCKRVTSTLHGIRLHIVRVHCKTKKPSLEPSVQAPLKKHDRDPVWIKEMVDKSYSIDGQNWTCCICGIFSSISNFGLTVHISRIHCIKPPTKYSSSYVEPRVEMLENVDEKSPFTSDAGLEKYERNLDWIREMVNKSKHEDLSEWTCCICNNVSVKTEKGMRFHIMRMHCKKPCTSDADVEKQTKEDYDPIRINEEIDNSNTTTGSWTCSICGDYTTSSRHGINLHIVKAHYESRHKKPFAPNAIEMEKIQLNVNQDILNTQDEAEKHDKDTHWIKEMVEKSRSSSFIDGFKCTICKNFSSKTEKVIRFHIMRKHCKNNKTKVFDILSKYKHDRNWINDVIERSKVSDGSYRCFVCQDSTSISRHGINLHIVKAHCAKPDKTQVIDPDDLEMETNEDSSNEIDDDYDYKEHQIMKTKSNGKIKKWLKKMIQKSETSGMTANGMKKWTCVICKNISSQSERGIKLHIIRMHRKIKKRFEITKVQKLKGFTITQTRKDQSKSNAADRRKLLKLAVKRGQDGEFGCVLCSAVKRSYQNIRYHVLKQHKEHLETTRSSALNKESTEYNSDITEEQFTRIL